jgi:type VI secretion system protein ImpC
MARDRIESFATAEDCARWLNAWLAGYVLHDPAGASEEDRARRPLAEGRVEVRPVADKPAFSEMIVRLKPHYQFEAVPAVPLTLTLRVQIAKRRD